MRPMLALTVFAALAAPAFAGEGGKKEAAPIIPLTAPKAPLADMMREVQGVQARMAKGDKDAYDVQRKLMRLVGAAIAAVDPADLKIKAERDAVVVYLLSGGQPRDVAKIVEHGDFPASERDMLRGAAGYTGGREADAEALLPYNPKVESLRLGSQLAYAQSVLLTTKDPRKALDLLDLARLLAPGTLIEEAALRREILLVGDQRDPERVAFLARQYVERFGKSTYAGDFVRTLAATAVRFDLCATLTDLGKFSALLALSPPEQARAFLLSVSRASLLIGRFEVASGAAREALASAVTGSSDEALARLYDLLARFPHLPDEQAKAAFAAIAPEKLSPADRDLFAAAGFAWERLYEMPPLAAYQDVWREARVAAARSPGLPQDNSDPASATIRRASAALAAAETLGQKDAPP